MKKNKLISILLSTCILCALAPTSLIGNAASSDPIVECYNGFFTGTTENGLTSFKGIPYAKAPVGKLRWKAPQPVEKTNASYSAKNFGKSCFQAKADSEAASMNPAGISEDCLTLNVFSKADSKKNKPVMFWIHGGAFTYGGTSDPLYNGQTIIEEHPDVIVVTANYRVGILGFADFVGAKVPGSEKYKEAGYLGILDQIEALRWVKQNIEAFGGDPNNVTIFGESAGGGSVAALLTIKEAEGLFQHAIAESGSVNFSTTHAGNDRYGQVQMLMKKTGAKNMDDLIKIPEEKLLEIYLSDDKNGCLASLPYLPLRGDDSIIPADPYQALADGMSKDVDLIIGTTTDENRYFIDAICDPELASLSGDEYTKMTEFKMNLFYQAVCEKKFNYFLSQCTDEEKARIQQVLNMYADQPEIWKRVEVINEYSFRLPAIQVALCHEAAGGTGNTYMYLFGKKNTRLPWIGACHACELSYVFHNLEDEQFSGPVDKKLADNMCNAWTNFAKTGNPTSKNMVWTPFTSDKLDTLVVYDDCHTEMVSDPKSESRKLLTPILKYYAAM